MKINKKLLLLVSLGCLMAPLAACGGSTGGGGGTTKVIFWHTMGKDKIATLETMITAFEKENPDIKIEQTAKGSYTDIATAVNNAIAAGDVPTMAFCYPDHVANYLGASAVVNIQDYLDDPELNFNEDDGLQSDFIKAYWDEGKSYDVEGIYSAPFYKSTEVLFYNKDAFDAKGWSVPTTWAEMETLMATIKADATYGSKTPLGYDSDDNLFITMCEQYGIPYTTNDNITTGADHFLFNNDRAKAMVTKIKGWYDNKYLVTQGTLGGFTSTEFKNGNLLMTIGSTGGTNYNYSDNFNIGIAAIPGAEATVEGGNAHVIMQGPSVCFLRRCTVAQKQAAWKFYKYCVKAENSAYYGITTGYSPVRQSSFETQVWTDFVTDETITGASDLIRRAVNFNSTLMDKYFVSATFKGSSTARTEVGGILTNVMTGSKTLADAFSDAYNNCVYAA